MSADKSKDGSGFGSGAASAGANKSGRKPYQSPRLTAYGAVQKLTSAITFGGKNDGGPGGMSRMV